MRKLVTVEFRTVCQGTVHNKFSKYPPPELVGTGMYLFVDCHTFTGPGAIADGLAGLKSALVIRFFIFSWS